MKTKLLQVLSFTVCVLFSHTNNAQAPSLGGAAGFVLFSTNGPLDNTGTSPLTGDIGTNNGTSSNYNNVIGSIHDQDAASALAATDLLAAYNQLNATSSTLVANPILGNGQILKQGAYHILTSGSLNATLTLDGESDANAVFIIKIGGAFATNAGSRVMLINGASPCNVFWIVEGALGMAAGSIIKGTFIANNGAISLSSGLILEGRALSTTGAITTDNITASIPSGCTIQSTITSQPSSQTVCVGSVATFTVFATGTGLTYQWRKNATNLVNGGNISGATSSVLTISPANATDNASDYNVVVTGSNSVAIVSANASLGVDSAPMITTEPANQTGCVDYSTVHFGIQATGAALTYQWRRGNVNITNGSNVSGANTATMTINTMSQQDLGADYNVIVSGDCLLPDTSDYASLTLCVTSGISAFEAKTPKISFHPNPFTTSLELSIHDASQINNSEVRIYNILGVLVMKTLVTSNTMRLQAADLSSGLYFYTLGNSNSVIQSGRLVSQ